MLKKQDIVDYYDQCEVDYKNNWHLDDCLALHIGYWDETTISLPQALLRQNEIMMKKGKITSCDRVLDAGCGIGGSSIYLSKNCGCRVMGITLSKQQAVSAAALSKIHKVDHMTRFQVMDFSETAFACETFDVIWALESSCYAESKQAFLEEAFRLLKPKGRLVLTDGFESKESYSLLKRKLIDNWIKRWAVDSLESVGRFESYLREAGFINIEFEDISKNVTPSSKKLFYRSLIAMPFAKVSEFTGGRTRIQNENLLGAMFQYFSLRLSLAKYGFFYAEKG
jgi:cyclopropane fatty-acyl-phospholipid synthase-like methyltransferase